LFSFDDESDKSQSLKLIGRTSVGVTATNERPVSFNRRSMIFRMGVGSFGMCVYVSVCKCVRVSVCVCKLDKENVNLANLKFELIFLPSM
jgi:hypothetical protein